LSEDALPFAAEEESRGRLFDSTKGVGQTETAMMAPTIGTFSTPATGIVVVTITILPL
jgi:hypothetical protein